jgi:hypothetical protein
VALKYYCINEEIFGMYGKK